MGPFPLQLAQRYVATHRVHYRSLSLTMAAKRSAAVVEMPFNGSPGQRFRPGRVGSGISVSDSVFDPVLSFNMRVYRGVVSTE